MSYEIEIAPNQFSKNNVVLQTIVVNPVQNAPVQTLHVKQEVDPNIGKEFCRAMFCLSAVLIFFVFK
jgi:hypothetical protein